EPDTGVHEVRLPLVLRRPQGREYGIAPRQCDASAADEGYGLPNPVARVGAGKLRVLEDRIEAVRLVVERIVVAATIQERQSRPYPVVVDRHLGGSEHRADVRVLGDENGSVFLTERVVEGRRQVYATEVSVAVVADVTHVVAARPLDADRCRAN